MGSYITAAKMVVYTGTALTTAEIDEIIGDVEDELEDMVLAKGHTASSSSALLKAAARALFKAEILERGIFDGGILRSIEKTIFRDDITSGKLREFAEKKIQDYVDAEGGTEALSDTDISETVVREDREMPTYNIDQSKIKEYHDRADETNNQDTDSEDTD